MCVTLQCCHTLQGAALHTVPLGATIITMSHVLLTTMNLTFNGSCLQIFNKVVLFFINVLKE